MALESANWVSELDATNPPGTDLKKQGDDHIRMLKTVLKASFPGASKAFYNPTTEAKTTDFTITAAHQNRTFVIDTTAGAVIATLPTLAVGDAGWECFFLKTNTGTNPYFIFPATGTIQSGDQAGLARTRRCIPGARSKAFWTGSAWIAERVVHVPVGTVLDIPRAGLAVGYEYAAGQTLASASTMYPDFYKSNADSAVVTDRRGRTSYGRDDMVSVAGVLTAGGWGSGRNTVGSTYGEELTTLTQARMPSYNLTLTVNISDPGHFHTTTSGIAKAGTGTAGVRSDLAQTTVIAAPEIELSGVTTQAKTTGITASGTAASGGSATPFSNIGPGIITNFMVVVE